MAPISSLRNEPLSLHCTCFLTARRALLVSCTLLFSSPLPKQEIQNHLFLPYLFLQTMLPFPFSLETVVWPRKGRYQGLLSAPTTFSDWALVYISPCSGGDDSASVLPAPSRPPSLDLRARHLDSSLQSPTPSPKRQTSAAIIVPKARGALQVIL